MVEPLVATYATPPAFCEAEFSVRVHVVKMAEPLLETYATPPLCEQKKKRKKKKRERERAAGGTEAQERKRREKNNVRVSAGCRLSKIGKRVAQQITHFTSILGQSTGGKDGGRIIAMNKCHSASL